MSSLEKPSNQEPKEEYGPAGQAGVFLPEDALQTAFEHVYVGRVDPLLRDGEYPSIFHLKSIGESFAWFEHFGEILIRIEQPDGSSMYFVSPEDYDAFAEKQNEKILGELATKYARGSQPETTP